jgi:hypothetical protein
MLSCPSGSSGPGRSGQATRSGLHSMVRNHLTKAAALSSTRPWMRSRNWRAGRSQTIRFRRMPSQPVRRAMVLRRGCLAIPQQNSGRPGSRPRSARDSRPHPRRPSCLQSDTAGFCEMMERWTRDSAAPLDVSCRGLASSALLVCSSSHSALFPIGWEWTEAVGIGAIRTSGATSSVECVSQQGCSSCPDACSLGRRSRGRELASRRWPITSRVRPAVRDRADGRFASRFEPCRSSPSTLPTWSI